MSRKFSTTYYKEIPSIAATPIFDLDTDLDIEGWGGLPSDCNIWIEVTGRVFDSGGIYHGGTKRAAIYMKQGGIFPTGLWTNPAPGASTNWGTPASTILFSFTLPAVINISLGGPFGPDWSFEFKTVIYHP